MTKVINLFGAPSAGKSTIAAALFSKMKFGKINVELVTEWIKGQVWEEHSSIFEDQIYITAKQNRMLHRLIDKVNWVVSDSPLILGLLYVKPGYYPSYKTLIKEMFNGYNNINYLIKRVKPYNPIGRNQNEEEAAKIHEDLVLLLRDLNIPYTVLDGDENAANIIFDQICALEDCDKCKYCGRECFTEYDFKDVCRFCYKDYKEELNLN